MNVRSKLSLLADRLSTWIRGERVVGYIGGSKANLGDSSMYEAAGALLGNLCSLENFGAEPYLRRIGLSGPRVFDAVVLGGGTLINQYGLRPCRMAAGLGVPMACLGTGAGSGGHDMPGRVDLGEWAPLLRRFDAVGVRGPVSLRFLEDIGVPHAKVIGDLALFHAGERPGEPNARVKRFGINLVRHYGHADYGHDDLVRIGRACRALAHSGWEPVPISMLPEDADILRRYLHDDGDRRTPAIHHPATAAEFARLVSDCAVVISMRLHGSILATCAGVPPLMLRYGDKCDDFAESMGLQQHVLRIGGIAEEAILELVGRIDGQGGRLRDAVLQTARSYKARQADFAQRLKDRFFRR